MLENFFFSNFSKSFSSKLYRRTNHFLWWLFNRFPLHGFSTYSPRKQPSLYAHGVNTVRNVTRFIGQPTPHVVSAVNYSVFCTSKEPTGWRTLLCLSQHLHNLNIIFLTKLTGSRSLTKIFTRDFIKFFAFNSLSSVLSRTFLWFETLSPVNFYQNRQYHSRSNYHRCCQLAYFNEKTG